MKFEQSIVKELLFGGLEGKTSWAVTGKETGKWAKRIPKHVGKPSASIVYSFFNIVELLVKNHF